MGGGKRLVWAAGLWAAVALLFCFLAGLAAFYDRFPSDERIAHEIQAIDVPAFGGFVDFVNALGSAWAYVPLTLAAAAAFLVLRGGTEAVLVLLTFVARGVNSLLKDWVERPRPSPKLVEVTSDASGSGFPSGHTVGTVALFGMLFFLIPAVVPWRPLRWALQAGCLLVVLAAGPARVYVGVHWPSDVLAGYLLAFLFVAPVVAAYWALRRRSASG
ncbi:MAG: hypothetical protein A2148_07775 [Chloroflexi bacterium RBG_16_68_14]|nr:MAG: hypothetical protein A2148_07775 [Chloroflexi bacterium RBG_16_68_14]